ncbi:unnamed protein product [Prunus brigantina]
MTVEMAMVVVVEVVIELDVEVEVEVEVVSFLKINDGILGIKKFIKGSSLLILKAVLKSN